MCALSYEPGITTIQFYIKLPSNPYKPYWITTEIYQETQALSSCCKHFLNNATPHFWITYLTSAVLYEILYPGIQYQGNTLVYSHCIKPTVLYIDTGS